MSRARRLLIILGNSSKLSELVIGLEKTDGQKYESYAYREIIDEIRHQGGYHKMSEIIGDDGE